MGTFPTSLASAHLREVEIRSGKLRLHYLSRGDTEMSAFWAGYNGGLWEAINTLEADEAEVGEPGRRLAVASEEGAEFP